MKINRLVSLLLVAFLVIPSVMSCGQSGETIQPTTVLGTTEQPVTGETSETRIEPNLPAGLNLDGYKFRLLYNAKLADSDWGVSGLYAEAENAEPINDAAFRRNKMLEEKYNFQILGTPMADADLNSAFIKKFIMSGSDDYDVIVSRQYNLGALITGNMLVDFKTVPFIDLDQPWWDKSITQQLSVANKSFAAFGDLIVTANNALRVMLFNKDMMKQLGYDMPYNLVKENKWTVDTLYQMCRDVYLDVNGNGDFDVEDRYGLLTQSGGPQTFLQGFGEDITGKDASDLPVITIGNERSLNAMTKISNFYTEKNVALLDTSFNKIYPGTEYKGLQDAFEAKRGLFFIEVLQLAERMRATDVDFGILPMPKLDEFQESYYSFADTWCMNEIVIPNTNTNLEKTGQILEALNAESKYTVVPAYYDKSLNGKFMRDTESSEMLDIILGSKRISLDEMYGWGLYGALNVAMLDGTGQYTSVLEKNIAKVNKSIEKMVASITAAD